MPTDSTNYQVAYNSPSENMVFYDEESQIIARYINKSHEMDIGDIQVDITCFDVIDPITKPDEVNDCSDKDI
jgi:hypothetical protein